MGGEASLAFIETDDDGLGADLFDRDGVNTVPDTASEAPCAVLGIGERLKSAALVGEDGTVYDIPTRLNQ